METTRHFTATVYVVNDGATALHEHERLGLTLPPGGHVDRDELPHETAIRECREETGLMPKLITEEESITADAGRSLPRPRWQMLYDIDIRDDGSVGHQHIDHIYFATVPSRDIDPGAGEASPDAWKWYHSEDLQAAEHLPSDVVELGQEAIATVEKHHSRKTA